MTKEPDQDGVIEATVTPEGYFIHAQVVSGREFQRDPKEGETVGRKSYVLFLQVAGEPEQVSFYERADLESCVADRDADNRVFVQIRKPAAYNGKVYLNATGTPRERQGVEIDLGLANR